MKNYQQANGVLNGRESRKIGNNTYLKRIDTGTIGVLLHQTYVVVYHAMGRVTLDSNGWQTNTTKARINEYSDANLSQKNSIWYMGDGSLFYDGMQLNGDGETIKPKQPAQKEKQTKMLKTRIKKYCELAIKKVDAGLDMPSGGDCWYCSMRTTENENLGDAFEDKAHLLAHMKDGYIVPSLLWNAVKEAGYQFPNIILGYEQSTMKTTATYRNERIIKTALSKYLYRRLSK